RTPLALPSFPTRRSSDLTDVEYLQFRAPRWIEVARTVAGILTWPVVWPLAMLSRTSDMLFRTVSELLSLLPYVVGVVVRAEFYRDRKSTRLNSSHLGISY